MDGDMMLLLFGGTGVMNFEECMCVCLCVCLCVCVCVCVCVFVCAHMCLHVHDVLLC